MIDLKMIYIFLLGLFLSLLYYIEEIIEEQEYKEKSLVVIGMLALIKAILGGILIVLIFYSLQDLKISGVVGKLTFPSQQIVSFVTSSFTIYLSLGDLPVKTPVSTGM